MANPTILANALRSFTRTRDPFEGAFALRPDGLGPIGPPPTEFRPGVPFGGFGVPSNRLEGGAFSVPLGLPDDLSSFFTAIPGGLSKDDLLIKLLLGGPSA